MIKSKLAISLDSIFIAMFSYLIIFFWIKKIIKNTTFALILSLFLSFLIFFALFVLFNKKNSKLKLSHIDKRKHDYFLQYFKYNSINNYSNFFEKLLNANHINNYIFENNLCLFYINFRTKITIENYYEMLDFKTTHSKSIVFISDKFDENFTYLLAKNDNISCFNFFDFYELMKTSNNFPATFDYKFTSIKSKFKDNYSKFKHIFNISNFKNYFISGLSLLILSFFIPFTLYYAIAGSLLLIISFVCLLNKNKINPSIYKNEKSLNSLAKKESN